MVMVCAVLAAGSAKIAHAAQQAATVRNIAVTGSDHDIAVQITASRPVTPRTQFVTGPDRLIVDLPETRPDAGLRKMLIQRGKLRDVRVGLLSANPPVTRVVLDLVAPPEFRVLPLANAVVVKLAEASGMESSAITPTSNPPAAVIPAASTSAVAITQLEEVSGHSWARWIMPILVTTTVLAMLLISLVVHIQNRRHRRGL
jgi:N-acetylmuramoyl-L-alanine amidase